LDTQYYERIDGDGDGDGKGEGKGREGERETGILGAIASLFHVFSAFLQASSV
jgi:hypothetical protein